MSIHTPEGLRTAISPFVGNFDIACAQRHTVEEKIDPKNIRVSDGIVTSVGTIDKFKKCWLVERDRKISLFFENDGEDLRPSYSQLSKEGRSLLDFILLYCLRENKLHCHINTAEFMKIYSISSRTTIWQSKKNLVDLGFIAPTSYKGWYWINPKFFFRGDRLKCDELSDNRKITNKE